MISSNTVLLREAFWHFWRN